MSLVLNNIDKTFGEKVIIKGLSLVFPEKGVFAVVGESGVGKTTLLRLIAGLDTDYSGEITGGGLKNVSFAFQEYRLFPTLSALDNVAAVYKAADKKEARENAEKMLLSLGFTEKDLKLYPRELSGGMKQRVSLSRAFLSDAPILLLDEPTKELDETNARLVTEEIRREAQKRLVILVSHRKEDISTLSPKIIDLSGKPRIFLNIKPS